MRANPDDLLSTADVGRKLRCSLAHARALMRKEMNAKADRNTGRLKVTGRAFNAFIEWRKLTTLGQSFHGKGREGFVYFIEAPSINLLKIGFTDNLEARLGALRTMSPVPLRTAMSMSCAFPCETFLHRQFAAYRSHGEWFRIEGQLASLLDSIRSVNGENVT